ncbi:hypothetical protein C8F04DRAFT_654608 [Mycena alexandri]|uniref:RING-type domain-containing protein n=1 Tax=Mycena alexandri TaxID=1745969 RepID=A0AAD6SR64_9AGAR|nr:hypothetical protein C8F04DRAFT_654608 [Mycena alexandri]
MNAKGQARRQGRVPMMPMGNLKVVARGRQAAARDCGICEEPAVAPVRTLCCSALFCKQHIDSWIYGPAATGLCPRLRSTLRPPALKIPLSTPQNAPERSAAHPARVAFPLPL